MDKSFDIEKNNKGEKMSHKIFRPISSLTVALAITFASVTPAFATPPTNDDFDFATPIFALPFNDTVDTSEAAAAFDDPTTCTNQGSVWYSFTPSVDMVIEANTFGSNYDTVLSVYTGTRGALTQVPNACNDDFSGLESLVNFPAVAGTTYYFLIGFCCGTGDVGGGGNLIFSVHELFPPSNDNFANAEPISILPFSRTVNITESTKEPDEPNICYFMNRTVWYSFIPTHNMTVHANTHGSAIGSNVNIYRSDGPGLNNLNFVGCAQSENDQAFQAESGQTYYLQVGPIFGQAGNIQINLEEFIPPPPQANFYFYPSDPSVFDTIQFNDQSYDPGGIGIQSFAWNFGDEVTAIDPYPTHRYAVDGDYTIQYEVTTIDGRTATTSQVVQVRTHDVSITNVAAPKSANVGQTRAITVSIRNNRYPDTVRIELYRSFAGGGFEWIATSTQFVPVRSGKRTSQFTFNYTFSPQDAQIGKVTFKAVVTIENARDTFPADNEAISTPPTSVKR